MFGRSARLSGRMGDTARGTPLVFVLACLVPLGAAQGRPGGGGPGVGGPGGGGRDGGISRNPFGGGNSIPNPRGVSPNTEPHEGGRGDNHMRGGLQLGPPGRWWDDERFAQNIGLAPAQQHRMDDVFSTNKGNLVRLFKSLQHEESQLSRLVRGKELVESQIFEQIDRVAQARGELEKANAHMLLEIRKEMTPEQVSRLDDQRPAQ